MAAFSNNAAGIFAAYEFGFSNKVRAATADSIVGGGSNIVRGQTSELIADGSSNIVGYLTVPPVNYVALASNTIEFGNEITPQLTLNVLIVTAIDLGASGSDRNVREDIDSAVAFANTLTVNQAIFVSVSNAINFGNRIQRTFPVSVTTSINLGGDSYRGMYPTSTLNFAQAAAVEASKLVTNDIAFNNTLASTNILNVQVSNTINFSNALAGLIPRSCDRSAFSSTSIPEVTFTQRSSILLNCDADSIELRNPELGNTEVVLPATARNVSRNGALTVYRDSTWPKQTTLSFDLRSLNRTDALSLQLFLYNCLGKEVTLTDYESRIWVGVITNPDAVISELDNNDCRYDISLIFVGNPQ